MTRWRLVVIFILGTGFLVASAMFPGEAAFAQGRAAVSAAAQLNALEQRRIAAIGSQDVATLQAILADDYVHVHGNGAVDSKTGFIKSIQGRTRFVSRGPLVVRSYGDVAILTGTQVNHTPVITNDQTPAPQLFVVTQVARRERGVWRFVSMQVVPVGVNVTNVQNFKGYAAGSRLRLTDDQQAIIDLEERRAAAISAQDFNTLAAVLADDYLHVYGSGATSDRGGYIKAVMAAPRVPTRGPLTVRVYGDVAVLTGDLLNRIEYPDRPGTVLDTFVTQVARKVDGTWKFASFQITVKTATQ